MYYYNYELYPVSTEGYLDSSWMYYPVSGLSDGYWWM